MSNASRLQFWVIQAAAKLLSCALCAQHGSHSPASKGKGSWSLHTHNALSTCEHFHLQETVGTEFWGSSSHKNSLQQSRWELPGG